MFVTISTPLHHHTLSHVFEAYAIFFHNRDCAYLCLYLTSGEFKVPGHSALSWTQWTKLAVQKYFTTAAPCISFSVKLVSTPPMTYIGGECWYLQTVNSTEGPNLVLLAGFLELSEHKQMLRYSHGSLAFVGSGYIPAVPMTMWFCPSLLFVRHS